MFLVLCAIRNQTLCGQGLTQYQQDKKHFLKLKSWFQNVFDPLVKRVDLRCWPWEAAVDAILASKPADGYAIKEFYSRCMKHNQSPSRLTR